MKSAYIDSLNILTVVNQKTAVCAAKCENGGTCIKPNVCECQTGYKGATCHIGKHHPLLLRFSSYQKKVAYTVKHACSNVPGAYIKTLRFILALFVISLKSIYLYEWRLTLISLNSLYRKAYVFSVTMFYCICVNPFKEDLSSKFGKSLILALSYLMIQSFGFNLYQKQNLQSYINHY